MEVETMKKAITILLAFAMVLSLAACGGTKAPEPTPEPTPEPVKEIELTKDNISDYVQFAGEFTEGKYTKSIVNYADAVLEFQAYPVVAGKFNNVEITLDATSNDNTFTYMNSFGNYWHLSDADKDTKKIEFTFKLGVDGKFSKKYSVECLNNTGVLSGNSDFSVVSVSGTFKPD